MPGPGGRKDGDVPVYALGSNPAERERLRRQSAELRDHSLALLDRAGIRQGWSAIDLGCGPSGVLDLLADRVGPGGHVTGVEVNPDNVGLARAFAVEQGLECVTVLEADARHTGLPASSFDLVHARTLLINVPDPAQVVTEMVRLAKPGGWVTVMEPDAALTLCYPPHPAWDRLVELFLATNLAHGADPYIGRRLPELFRQAGLTGIDVEAKADIYPLGHSRRTIRLDLVRSMRPAILERGLASEHELNELDHAAREHLADPNTLALSHLLFLAWGRKPVS